MKSVFWNSSQTFLPPVFENQRNGFGKVHSAFLLGFPLTVGTRNLRAIRDKPFPITFDDGRELVMHYQLPYLCLFTRIIIRHTVIKVQ